MINLRDLLLDLPSLPKASSVLFVYIEYKTERDSMESKVLDPLSNDK